MNLETAKAIKTGQVYLGIELGSTRIKAILTDASGAPVASGSYDWQNRLENGIWTYSLKDVWKGLQSSYAALCSDVLSKYGEVLERLGGIGISAMMHGYLPFDQDNNQLTEFRTWRNTTTEQAATELTELFGFNIPQRWSIAHLYQAMLNGEKTVEDIAFLTTLSGYVHWRLTEKKVLGVGDASGMFPINSKTNRYDAEMVSLFDKQTAGKGLGWKLADILPQVLPAGQAAGNLTQEGARLLDPTGRLLPGVPFCPPEGDAGTGMVATNSVAPRTGNVSAGTSIFAMVVLEKPLSKRHTEIDMVTTPSGSPAAMVHCNNCTSDLDAYVRIFQQLHEVLGLPVKTSFLYDTLYRQALEGDSDCGGVFSCNYFSGEPITGFEEGRPLLARTADARFTLPNLARSLLFSTMTTLKIGMDILTGEEQVKVDKLTGHGGLFKTREVGQSLMAAALKTPVEVMESAGEGGAWGISLLAAYAVQKNPGETLEDYLESRIFAGRKGICAKPKPEDVAGFEAYLRLYKKGLSIELTAVDSLAND